jgi:hypothetical protein
MPVLKLMAVVAPSLEVPDDSLQKTYLESFGDQEFAKNVSKICGKTSG